MRLKTHLILLTRDAATHGTSLLQLVGLAYLDQYNMAVILNATFSVAFFNEKYSILNWILLNIFFRMSQLTKS